MRHKKVVPGRSYRRVGQPYTPPLVPFGSAEDSFDYDEERRKWAESLEPLILRALATDYYRGIDTSDVGKDAYEEFRRRFPKGKLRRSSNHTPPEDDRESSMINDEQQPLTSDQGVVQPASR